MLGPGQTTKYNYLGPAVRREGPGSKTTPIPSVSLEPGWEGCFSYGRPGCVLDQIHKHAHLQPESAEPSGATLTNASQVIKLYASSEEPSPVRRAGSELVKVWTLDLDHFTCCGTKTRFWPALGRALWKKACRLRPSQDFRHIKFYGIYMKH